jgi:hypothetical protein
MKFVKKYKEFLNEELKYLPPPPDEETFEINPFKRIDLINRHKLDKKFYPTDIELDKIFNKMTPDEVLNYSIRYNIPKYIKKAIDNDATIIFNNITHINDLNILKYIFNSGKFDINRSYDGITLLMYAAMDGNYEKVKFLVEHGAKFTIKQLMKLESPLTLISREKKETAINILKKYTTPIKENYNDVQDEEYSQEDEEYREPEIPSIKIDDIFYHGTTTQRDGLFDYLSTNESDYEAIWFTDDEYIAEKFAENKNYNDEDITTIYKIKVKLDDIADINYALSKELKDFYELEDFRDIIPILKNENFNGWKTSGSIGYEQYDDYAIFNGNYIDILEVKFLLDNDWTDYLPLDKAKQFLLEKDLMDK